jgi:hypothetical protein
MARRVMACLEADFDSETGTCAAPIWDAELTGLPQLSIADAQAIGVSFAYLFAVAFVFRLMRKALHQIG